MIAFNYQTCLSGTKGRKQFNIVSASLRDSLEAASSPESPNPPEIKAHYAATAAKLHPLPYRPCKKIKLAELEAVSWRVKVGAALFGAFCLFLIAGYFVGTGIKSSRDEDQNEAIRDLIVSQYDACLKTGSNPLVKGYRITIRSGYLPQPLVASYRRQIHSLTNTLIPDRCRQIRDTELARLP